MITKDPKQIEILRTGAKILATVLNLVASKARVGVSAWELDQLAEIEIRKAGGVPAFKNYRAQTGDPPFPATLCVSVNDEVVHGIPTKDKVLRDGDLVGLDLGMQYQGLFTDMAITVGIGQIDETSQKLIQAAQESLTAAIKMIRPGVLTGDIGATIESVIKGYKFQVVRELVGHGVGGAVHEEPEVPCFGKPGTGMKLGEGQVIAVEPMVNAGGWKIIFAKDNWTIKTADASRSAHAEHTLIITKTGCEVLTLA